MYFLKDCRRSISLTLIFALLLFTSGTAFAQTESWSTPVFLSEAGQETGDPRVAVSTDGTRATAIWLRPDGSFNRIQSASATISGNTPTWGTPVTLSEAGQPGSGGRVALSHDGTKAVAIWNRSDGVNNIIQSATATINGSTATWSAPQDLSSAGQDASSPRVAISSDGTRAIAVWYRSNGVNDIIQAATATISNNTATWSVVQNLSVVGQSANSPDVEMSEDGTKATVVWTRSNGTDSITQSASATISNNIASWGATSDLSEPGVDTLETELALSADGTMATAVWRRDNGTDQVIQSASASVSGNSADWSSAVDLSEAGQSMVYPVIVLSNDGTRATAAWYRTSSEYFAVRTSSATISGNTADWSPFVEISSTGLNSYFVDIALSEDGSSALAMWTSIDDVVPASIEPEAFATPNIIQSSTGIISGNTAEWTAPEYRSDAAFDATVPRLDISSDGRWATAVWLQSDGSNRRVVSASADLDLCPNDADKIRPGICGCGVADTDSDSDGTADCEDECDSDAGKSEAGICGCDVADTDSDSDGTADCNDECSADPDKSTAGDCGCGLADTDSDENGVSDCLDVALTVSKTFTQKDSKKAVRKLTDQLKSQKSIARILFNNGRISAKLFKQIIHKAIRIKFLLERSLEGKGGRDADQEASRLSKAYNKRLKKLKQLLSA